MMLVTSHRSVEVRGLDLTHTQIARLQRTLQLLPPPHLRGLRYIRIRDRADYEGGSTNPTQRGWRRQEPDERRFWVMIDIDSFDPRHRPINNRPNGYHYTLLHEMGHVVDWSFNAMNWIRRHDRAGYQAMLAHPHSGITQGAFEHFADAYADFFFYPEAERQLDRRMEALMACPAWTELDTPALRQDWAVA